MNVGQESMFEETIFEKIFVFNLWLNKAYYRHKDTRRGQVIRFCLSSWNALLQSSVHISVPNDPIFGLVFKLLHKLI